MPFAFPRRGVKQLIAPLLPESWKAPFRARLFGYGAAAAVLPVEFSTDERGPTITIGGRVALRFREEDRLDMDYQFVANGDAIDEIARFIELAASAGTLLDVGASKGVFSQIFCLIRPAARAVSFEPSASAMMDARALAELNGCAPRITFRQVAVGRAVGRASGGLSPAGFVSIAAGTPEQPRTEFEMTSLDHEVRALGVVPDLIKIDVEGYEYEVLIGARQLLAREKPPICLELHLDLLERRGVRPQTVMSELQSHGYRFKSCSGAELSATRICHSAKAILRFIAEVPDGCRR
jgi:FkbM family methyltransferase